MSKEVLAKTLTLVTSAFGLVAALAWNEAIQKLIAKFFPKGTTVISLFTYAILITALAVFVTIRLAKLEERVKKQKNESKQ